MSDKHFNCSNCKRVYKIVQRNGFMCTGLVKLPYKHDYFRLCMIRDGRYKSTLDLKRTEVKDVIELLSNLLIYKEKGNGEKRAT